MTRRASVTRPALTFLLGLIGGLPGCGDEAAAAPEAGMPAFRVPVTWGRIEAGELVEAVELVGDVVSRQHAELAFERGGRVEELLADLGDEVAAGAVLARLDDDVLQQELAVARAQLEAARETSGWLDREAERGRSAGARVLNDGEIDRRVTVAAAGRSNRAEREADVLRLQERLEQGTLVAPFDGVVTRRDIALGSFAAEGRTVFALVDLAHREVRVEVPAPLAAGLATGAPATLRCDALPGAEWNARLDELVPAADPATRTFTGVLRLEAADPQRRLLPGLFVRVRLERSRVASPTLVPADAVITDERGARVTVADLPASDEPGPDGLPPAPVARLVPVQVLARDRERAAVEALEPGALAPGAIVLVTGADNVWPGAPLMLQPPPGAP